jgi:hypothetical protein
MRAGRAGAKGRAIPCTKLIPEQPISDFRVQICNYDKIGLFSS